MSDRDATHELAELFIAQGMRCAAALLRVTPVRAVARTAICGDLMHSRTSSLWDSAAKALLEAWSDNDDACVLAAIAAWDRCGCDLCAIAVCHGTDTNGRCASCVEDGR